MLFLSSNSQEKVPVQAKKSKKDENGAEDDEEIDEEGEEVDDEEYELNYGEGEGNADADEGESSSKHFIPSLVPWKYEIMIFDAISTIFC